MTKVDVSQYYQSDEECLDNHQDVIHNCHITLPDNRELFEVNGELVVRLQDGTFETYEPVMALMWDEKIKRIKNIVDTRSCAMIEGLLVDLFTASGIMAVYNATESNLKNRLKFLSWSIPKMADFAWKVIK